MRRSLIISGTAHAVLMLWGLVAFAARPSEAPATEALPVEFVSATQFSQMTAGVKNAPKPIENAKPLADKVGDPKPVKELAPKVADKPEIKTAGRGGRRRNQVGNKISAEGGRESRKKASRSRIKLPRP